MAKRVPVVRDVNDPRFPHGTPTGYSRGCPKECCLRARRRLKDATREAEGLARRRSVVGRIA